MAGGWRIREYLEAYNPVRMRIEHGSLTPTRLSSETIQSSKSALNPLAQTQSNHELGHSITCPQLHCRKVGRRRKLAPRRMDCKYHPSVEITPFFEPLYVVV